MRRLLDFDLAGRSRPASGRREERSAGVVALRGLHVAEAVRDLERGAVVERSRARRPAPSRSTGVTTRILVGDAIVTVSAFFRPNFTCAWVLPGWNPPPTMVISSPPAVVPCGGSTESTLSGPPLLGAGRNATRSKTEGETEGTLHDVVSHRGCDHIPVAPIGQQHEINDRTRGQSPTLSRLAEPAIVRATRLTSISRLAIARRILPSACSWSWRMRSRDRLYLSPISLSVSSWSFAGRSAGAGCRPRSASGPRASFSISLCVSRRHHLVGHRRPLVRVDRGSR